jgi:hypothetical protein
MYQCHGMKGNQHWEYLQTAQVRHVVSNTCMELAADGKRLVMSPCDASNLRQQWVWPRRTPQTSAA